MLSKPAPFLIKALTAAESPMMPKHIYEGTDPLTNQNGNAPVGTGPYRFKEWVRGSHVIFERNPDYWQPGLPHIDQMVCKFVPDPGARSVAFENGSGDIGYRTPVALADLDRLKKLPNLVFETDGTSYSYNVSLLQFNLDSQYFKHLKVRQAVAHCIDRALLVKTVMYGYGPICYSPIAPGLKDFHDPTPSPYTLDFKKAEQLLDEAGFPRGANKIRFKIPMDYNPIGDDGRKTCEFMRATLSRVGIAVEVRSQDLPAFAKRVYTDRDFDCTYNGHSNLMDPDGRRAARLLVEEFQEGRALLQRLELQQPEGRCPARGRLGRERSGQAQGDVRRVPEDHHRRGAGHHLVPAALSHDQEQARARGLAHRRRRRVQHGQRLARCVSTRVPASSAPRPSSREVLVMTSCGGARAPSGCLQVSDHDLQSARPAALLSLAPEEARSAVSRDGQRADP